VYLSYYAFSSYLSGLIYVMVVFAYLCLDLAVVIIKNGLGYISSSPCVLLQPVCDMNVKY